MKNLYKRKKGRLWLLSFFLAKIVFSFFFSWSRSCFFFLFFLNLTFFLVEGVLSFFFSWSKAFFLSFFFNLTLVIENVFWFFFSCNLSFVNSNLRMLELAGDYKLEPRAKIFKNYRLKCDGVCVLKGQSYYFEPRLKILRRTSLETSLSWDIDI